MFSKFPNLLWKFTRHYLNYFHSFTNLFLTQSGQNHWFVFFLPFFFLVGGLHMTLNYWKWTYKTLSKSIRTSTPQGCYVVLPEQPFPLCVSYGFVCSVAHFILATNSFISTAAWSQLFCTLVTHVSCHGSGWSMLLAQLNRDSQGMTEFHDADGQPVTLCLTEAVTVAGELN